MSRQWQTIWPVRPLLRPSNRAPPKGQSVPQLMPAGLLVTVPVPVPAFVTVRSRGTGLNVAVTVLAASMVTWQVLGAGVAVHVAGAPAPLQLVNAEPAAGAAVSSLAMAFVSCSNWQAGWFTAYRHLAEERPDLVLHLGDYQYEGPGNSFDRAHVGGETVTLADYRRRHAQYKADLHLQAAHHAAPWIVTWDDHEVANDYANDRDGRLGPAFL